VQLAAEELPAPRSPEPEAAVKAHLMGWWPVLSPPPACLPATLLQQVPQQLDQLG
jgi:hypothetical protein